MSDRAAFSAGLAFSPAETERFGFRVFRGTFAELDAPALLDSVIANDVDIVFLRLPAEKQYRLALLDGTGLPWLAADTLVWYESNLADYCPAEIENRDIRFVPVEAYHRSALDQLVADAFTDYHNHYASNPLLQPAAILASYQDWARRYITGSQATEMCWLVQQGDRFVAFVTCRRECDRAEIVMNGVQPSAAGKGIYTDLVRFVQRRFKDEGVKVLEISTQAHNYVVQRVWNREGFVLKRAFCTVHINALWSRSVVGRCQFELPPADSVAALWHSAAETAIRECWHKTLGPKIHAVGHSARFVRPAAGKASVTVSFPVLDVEHGSCRSLLRVSDSSRQVAAFSYHDFVLEQS